ncbi:MAG: CHASE2 domain-containing protein [Hyphomicrobiales bacterium]
MKNATALLAGFLVLLASVTAHFYRPATVETLSLAVFDTFQRLKPRTVQENAPVRIIDIDEASLKKRGQWPWPRSDIAKLVERLGQMGAAVVTFDMVFSEPDRTSPHRIAGRLKESALLPETTNLSSLPDNDRTLAKTFSEWPVVAGMVFMRQKNTNRPPVKTGFAIAGSDPRASLVTFNGSIHNLPVLEEAVPGIGYFNFEPDRFDRTVRRVPVVAGLGGELYPSLLAETVRVAQRAGSMVLKSSDASGEANWSGDPVMTAIKIGDIEIPTNEAGEVWLYHSGHKVSRFISAYRILNATPAELAQLQPQIAGHVVFIGASAAGLLDIVATPLSSATAGVEVQADALEMVLAGQFLTRPDWARGAELAVTIILSCFLIFLMPVIGARWCGVLGAIVVVLSVGGAWVAFSHYRYLFDTVYPLMGTSAVYLVVSGALFLTAENERLAIRRSFSQYLAPELVERLARDPKALKLGGEECELTVLFSDVRDFTTLSESLTSGELGELMNAYFTPMSDVLLKADATIDKYIGDAIMAFWNAPLDVDGHPARACAAALEMLNRLDGLRKQRGLDLRIGIGLNTGFCSVGNFGSEQRFNYSVFGDPVNLAARIEGLTKLYGADILIGETTARAADRFALIEMDLIRVVGKTKPERVFALAGDAETAGKATFFAVKTAHENGIEAYRKRKWAAAQRYFDDASRAAENAEDLPLDYAATHALYKSRIAGMRKKAPPKNWDGASEALSK